VTPTTPSTPLLLFALALAACAETGPPDPDAGACADLGEACEDDDDCCPAGFRLECVRALCERVE